MLLHLSLERRFSLLMDLVDRPELRQNGRSFALLVRQVAVHHPFVGV